jgi:methionyl-tRNA formyltransferase
MKKLTIFAMTEKGYAVVSSIFSAHKDIIDTVVSARDKNVSNDRFGEIESFCRDNGIKFRERSNAFTLGTDYAIAISWRWMVDHGSSRLIVFHDSPLPRYRGFNPLVTALINGDTEIGVTALFASADYDRGEIISQSLSTIAYPITIRDAIKTIVSNYVDLAVGIADKLARDEEIVGTPQSEASASYSLWRDEKDYFIDWAQSAATIRRTIDAMGFPYKGAATTIDGKIARILKAEALDDLNVANRVCGKVIFVRESKPVVVCGQGLLRIDELVDDSGRSMIPLTRFRTRFEGASGGDVRTCSSESS